MMIRDRKMIDRKIVEKLSRKLDTESEQDMKFVKFLLLESSFTRKSELVGMLLAKSKTRGRSLLRSLLWV